jgi:hypothetical protein
MFKKLINSLFKRIGYVQVEKIAIVNLEIRGTRKELSLVTKKYQELKKLNTILSGEVTLLLDENQSLWNILDEEKGSKDFGKDQVRSMIQELEETLTDEMMKNFKPIGEA